MLTEWRVEHWYVSGVHTGFRVVRRGPRGHVEYREGFVGDIYEPGSFDRARAKADTAAVVAKLKARAA